MLSIESCEKGLKVSYSLLQQAQLLDDYILDACWSTGELSVSEHPTVFLNAYAVTVFNQLFSLKFSLNPINDEPVSGPQLVSQGPSCALYSAHIEILDSGSLLVAAGTVFGAVHVWRSSILDESSDFINPQQVTL